MNSGGLRLGLSTDQIAEPEVNNRKKAEGLNDVDDEIEQFYTRNCLTFNKKITWSKVTYNGNEQCNIKTRLDNCISYNKL